MQKADVFSTFIIYVAVQSFWKTIMDKTPTHALFYSTLY